MSSIKTKEEPTQCDELALMTDFQERLEHEMLGCPVCLRIKTRNALVNQISTVETSASKVEEGAVQPIQNVAVKNSAESFRKLINYGDQAVKSSNVRFNSRPAKKPRLNSDVSEPEMRKHDKLIIRDMIRIEGLNKKEAALKLVEQRRRPKMDNVDRINIAPDQMPWQPTLRVLCLPRESYSTLLPVDHKRYVAIISNFLSPLPNFRFEMNKVEIEALDDRLKAERELFNKAAFDSIKCWKKSPFRYQAMGSLDFFCARESAKYNTVLGNSSYLEKVGSVDWPRLYHRNDHMTSPNYRLFVTEVLQPGKQLRIHIPDVRRKCEYNMNSSVIEQHFALEPAVKIPIQEDEQAIELAMEKGIEFVMDGSTVRHLMSNRWPNRDQMFANKVSVVQRVQKGSIHRIIFVSKPVLASQLEILYLTRQYAKWAAKCELRKKFVPNSSKLRNSKTTLREMINSKTELLIKTKEESKSIVSVTQMEISDEPTKKNESAVNCMEESDNEDCSLKIEENTKPSSTSSSNIIPSTSHPKEEVKDILGGILDSMGINMYSEPLTKDIGEKSQNFVEINMEKADHPDTSRTKRYSVMRFDAEGEHEVLVRTSNHGVDQNGIQVSVTIKTEFIPEVGSDKLHLEEQLWNLVTSIVKDSTEHCNLHIYPRVSHCLQIKRTSGNKRLSNLLPELKQLLESRTARMTVLMDSLGKLEAGEYLIIPEGNSMTILKQAKDVNPSEIPSEEVEFDRGTKVYNRTSLAKKSLLLGPRFSNDLNKNWNGLDPHFPLVWHIMSGRIPGSLYPRRRNDLTWRPDQKFKQSGQQQHQSQRGHGRGGRGYKGAVKGNKKTQIRNPFSSKSDANEMKMDQDGNE